MSLFDSKIWAAFCAVALVGCSAPTHGANETVASELNATLADEKYMSELHKEFVEISGKDFVEFTRGSAVLSAAAEFRLERQALWLRAYPMVSVRLVASGDGLERIGDRRLAMARARAVERHLILVGVEAHQISGIDIEPAQNGNRQRVLTAIDLIQSAGDE